MQRIEFKNFEATVPWRHISSGSSKIVTSPRTSWSSG